MVITLIYLEKCNPVCIYLVIPFFLRESFEEEVFQLNVTYKKNASFSELHPCPEESLSTKFACEGTPFYACIWYELSWKRERKCVILVQDRS